MEKTYDAVDRVSELIPTEIVLGEKTYRVKRTGKAFKEIIKLQPDEGKSTTADQNIDLLYKGLSLLLVDEKGGHPPYEILEDEMDFEVAQELMEKFTPRRDEGNEPASDAAPSTAT